MATGVVWEIHFRRPLPTSTQRNVGQCVVVRPFKPTFYNRNADRGSSAEQTLLGEERVTERPKTVCEEKYSYELKREKRKKERKTLKVQNKNPIPVTL